MNKTIAWLRDKVYLPEYMTLTKADQINNMAYFNFNLVEPPVERIGLNYLTPRGSHICISQASYWFFEKFIEIGKLDFLDVNKLRNIALEGRLKIIELNQKFRKEIKLYEKIEGKFILTNLRLGKMPLFKMDFDLGGKAIRGEFIGVIAPKPVPQINADITRNLK